MGALAVSPVEFCTATSSEYTSAGAHVSQRPGCAWTAHEW
jgi:hypothetical protein